jgi:ABC-type sugar transport system ATPase subunit
MKSSPILEVRDISKRFGGVHALEKVSLDLYAGEVLALAGDNGAGTGERSISNTNPDEIVRLMVGG